MSENTPRVRRQHTDVAFTKVRLQFGWLGNMAPYPVTYQGVVARTTEHLFQALRLGLDTDSAMEVLRNPSPMGAKLTFKGLVRDGARLRYEPRSAEDLDAMRLCLRLKLEQHASLRHALDATQDYNVVEDTSSRAARGRPDTFWGAQVDGDDWLGHNHVGRIWMELRGR